MPNLNLPIQAVPDQVVLSHQIGARTEIEPCLDCNVLPLLPPKVCVRVHLNRPAEPLSSLLNALPRYGVAGHHPPEFAADQELREIGVRRIEVLALEVEGQLSLQLVAHERDRLVRAAAAVEADGDVVR